MPYLIGLCNRKNSRNFRKNVLKFKNLIKFNFFLFIAPEFFAKKKKCKKKFWVFAGTHNCNYTYIVYNYMYILQCTHSLMHNKRM